MATRKTFDLILNGKKFLNFDTKKDAEKYIKDSKKTRYISPISKLEIIPRQSRGYSVGDMWRDDFDYEGMVKKGSEAKINWGIIKLNKLFESYEDVNYHSPSSPLFESIELLKKGQVKEAEEQLKIFREANKKILRTTFKWYPKSDMPKLKDVI